MTAALTELGLELERRGACSNAGLQWILEAKSELLELLSGVRGLPLEKAEILSEEHKAVLLITIGYRRKGGVSEAKGRGELLSFGFDLLRPFQGVEVSSISTKPPTALARVVVMSFLA